VSRDCTPTPGGIPAGADHDGGTVVFTGTPADMIANATTLTADHLRDLIDD